MKNLIMYKSGEVSWIRWIKKRIKNNLNFLAICEGPTGIGKTWTAMSIAEKIDPEFSVNQICFDFKEFMSAIDSDWFKAKKWKIVIFDEPQISISNRNWQSLTNKLMNYLLSTFRHQNIIVLFCCPYHDFLDSQSMRLLHCLIQCEGVDKKKKLSRVRPKILQYNSHLKKTYQHPLYVIRGKKTIPLREWYIPKPSIELINEYEAKKTSFTSNLNKEILNKLHELSKDKEEPTVERRPLTAKQEMVMKVLAKHKYKDAVKITGMGLGQLHSCKKYSMKKGYKLEEFRDEA